jgi:cellulase
MSLPKTLLFAAAACFKTASAHGHVANIIVNGASYEGYDAPSWFDSPDVHQVIGWTEGATDNGFVPGSAYQDSAIICHQNASNAAGHAAVQAGDKIALQWDTWPTSHKGPAMDYMAKCPGLCEEANMETLEFFKVDDGGLINDSSQQQQQDGYWASDVLIANNFSWIVQVPEQLVAGNYVLRHEIIALHEAESVGGAQNYPQCVNLQVQGTGTLQPTGKLGTDLYHVSDAGILFNIYTSPLPAYTPPGPALYTGFSSTISQAEVQATATATATVPGGAKATGPASGGGGGACSAAAAVTSSPTSSSGSGTDGNGDAVQEWDQCGGQNWVGPSQCVSGLSCVKLNDYYYQCLQQ